MVIPSVVSVRLSIKVKIPVQMLGYVYVRMDAAINV